MAASLTRRNNFGESPPKAREEEGGKVQRRGGWSKIFIVGIIGIFLFTGIVGFLFFNLSSEPLKKDFGRNVEIQPVKRKVEFSDIKLSLVSAIQQEFFGELSLVQAIATACRDSSYVLVYCDQSDGGALPYMLASYFTYDTNVLAYIIALHHDKGSEQMHSKALQKLSYDKGQQELIIGGTYNLFKLSMLSNSSATVGVSVVVGNQLQSLREGVDDNGDHVPLRCILRMFMATSRWLFVTLPEDVDIGVLTGAVSHNVCPKGMMVNGDLDVGERD